MTTMPIRLLAILLLLGSLATLIPARAAQSYESCDGFIDTVPTTITTQGVWCLRQHLSTNITSGNAIVIANNNVTIDCNGFKIGGLAAGTDSQAYGIAAYGRQNVIVRHCTIRGFNTGITLNGGAGHVIEDNRLDNNLSSGIFIAGDNNRVRRNAVFDTGGLAGSSSSRGISGYADFVDNKVSGLFADTAGGTLHGIRSYAPGARIDGNTVTGFDMSATGGGSVGNAIGIDVTGSRTRVSANQVIGDGTNGHGVRVHNTALAYCLHNTVGGFATSIHANCASSGNMTSP